MSAWTVAWIAWGAVFLVIELPAVFDARRGNTLSEHVWRYVTRPFGTGSLPAWIGRGGVAAFLIWLTGHLVFGWWSI